MKFSERWLREWVDPPVDSAGLVAQLTGAGLEVDAVEPAAGGDLAGVVVGRVLQVSPHPDADKLRVCQVDAGQGEPLTIVCGAPNVHAGMRAPTALVGAVLPGGMEIKQASLRGVASAGMLCSAAELGLAEDAAGLMPLPADAPVGAALRDYLGLDDVSIEVDLTPNRGDCLGIAGIAREVGVLNRLAVTPPAMEPVAAVSEDTLPVTVEAPADCPRYLGRVIRDVDPAAPSPLWLRERLRRSGLRSISALVDITNHVLLELGQPMHAFDLERLQGGIRVRRAAPGERLELLDDSTVDLDPDTLVIADDSGPVALAGIMGGAATAVGEGTRHVFLESAFFAPTVVAGRARRYARQSDSSHRFERGVDPELQRRALERATALVLEVAGGRPGPVIEAASGEHLPRRPAIPLRAERIRRVLGMPVDDADVDDILTRLGATVTPAAGGWAVQAPSFRFDLEREVDLIEELVRVIGYDRVPATTPAAHLHLRPEPEERVSLGAIQDVLTARGYREAITFSFVEPRVQERLDPGHPPIALANPISADLAVMRTTLWSSLLGAVAHNLNRQQGRVRLFETGLRFLGEGESVRQEAMVAGACAGSALPEQWGASSRPLDFFDVKGDVEALAALGGAGAQADFLPLEDPALHPGQAASVVLGGEVAGRLGALHPEHLKALDLAGPVYLFELSLEVLRRGRLPAFTPLSRFPLIRRDLALVVPEAVTAAQVHGVIGQAAPDMLKNLQLFDVYRGEHIDSGKKSLALALYLQAAERTLTDAEVDAALGRIVDVLTHQLGAELRG